MARASFDFAGCESALTTATAAWTSTATTSTATIVVCGPSATVWWSTSLDRYALYSVEVRLVLFVDLLPFFLIEVVSAFNQDCALIGARLTLVEVIARLCRHRNGRRLGTGFLGFRGRGRLRQLRALFLDERLTAQLDAVPLDSKNLDHHLITFAKFVLHFLNPVLCDLRDVEQAVGAWKEFDKCAKFGEPHHLAQIGLADLGNSGDVVDDGQRLFQPLGIAGCHTDTARVVHVDLGAGLLDDATDGGAALANQVADLVRWNLHGFDTRCILRPLLMWPI